MKSLMESLTNPIKIDLVDKVHGDDKLHLLKYLKDKKIVIVSNSCWNIYNFRSNIIQMLLDLGAKVHILAPIDETIQHLSKLSDVSIVPLHHLKRNSSNPFSELVLFRELYAKYKKIQPDYVLHYTIKPNIYGSIATGMLKVNSASVVTGLGYTFLHDGWLKQLVERMYRFAFKFNKTVIFENQDDKQLFIDLQIINTQKAVSVKGCGVNVDHFKTKVNRIDRENTSFLFIGRLLYDKGIREYIEAAKVLKLKYPDIKFVVVGLLDKENPSYVHRDTLMEWINSGAIEYYNEAEDVRPFLEKSDCIVLPSYREGLPKVIIEAMAMALPVITTNTAGCRETTIENENGFLVPTADINALITAMEKFILLSNGNRYRMGQKSLKKAHNEFLDTSIATEILKLMANSFV